MFFSKKKEEKSEDLKKLEESNRRLEEQLAAMERKFSQLTSRNEEVSSNKSPAFKEVYEDQLHQVFEKKKELEDKIQKVNQMMSQMEEMGRKQKDTPQVPPMQNAQPNWMPPNSSFYGAGPGQMGYSGQQSAGMTYPAPHPPGNSGPFMPMGPQQPMHSMHGPQQGPPNPRFQPPRGPQMNFQTPPLMNSNPQYQGRPRYNRPYFHRTDQNDQSGDKPFKNRDENRGRHEGKERPLFLNHEQNRRSKSQPRNRGKSISNPNEENGSNAEASNADGEQQKQVRFEHKGRYRGRGNFHGNTFSNRNSNGPEHDRRTNFKRSSRGRTHDQRSRAQQNVESVDSDDLSDSSNNSTVEESNGATANKDTSLSSGVSENKSMPDVIKHEKKKEKKSALKKEDKKSNSEHKVKKNEENRKKAGKKDSSTKKNKPKETEEKNKQDNVPLSKNNLGENDLLMKFVGTSIPSLLDALCLQVDLNTKVSGIILMSDPSVTQPILETPKTLFDIVNFKMKHVSDTRFLHTC